jgi:hypothetical protein
MGWEALANWGKDAVRTERISGGVANDVWSIRLTDRSRSPVSAPEAMRISHGKLIC